ARLGGGEDGNASRLAEDQRGTRVLRVEDVLERNDLRTVKEQFAREAFMERAQPILDRAARGHLEDAVRQVAHAGAAGILDDAEAAVPRTGIDPEDLHCTRDSIAAISSSGISKFAWTCCTSSFSSRFSTSRSTFSAVSPETCTVLFGKYAIFGAPTGSLPSRALCTCMREPVSVRTSKPPSPSESTSSAPASSASSITSSSLAPFFTGMTPLWSNWNATAPEAAMLPPPLVKMARTSPAVRFLLSVRISRTNATPPGPYPS